MGRHVNSPPPNLISLGFFRFPGAGPITKQIFHASNVLPRAVRAALRDEMCKKQYNEGGIYKSFHSGQTKSTLQPSNSR